MPKPKKPPPPAVTRPVFAEPHEDGPVVVAETSKPLATNQGRCAVCGWVRLYEKCHVCGTHAPFKEAK